VNESGGGARLKAGYAYAATRDSRGMQKAQGQSERKGICGSGRGLHEEEDREPGWVAVAAVALARGSSR